MAENGNSSSRSVSPIPFYHDLMMPKHESNSPFVFHQSYNPVTTVGSSYNFDNDDHSNFTNTMTSNSTFQWQARSASSIMNNHTTFVNTVGPKSDSSHYYNSKSMNDAPFGTSSYQPGFTLHNAMKISMANSPKPELVTPTPTVVGGPNTEKPVKTLSAYNFFFRHQRERILAGYDDVNDDDYSPSRKESLLFDHWYKDRTVKRRHRKSHGKVSFAMLSRMVAQRWKDLSEDRRNFYKDLAAEDMKRYRYESLQHELGMCTPYVPVTSKCNNYSHPVSQVNDMKFQASTFFDFTPIPTFIDSQEGIISQNSNSY